MNLADEIIRGKRSSEAARDFYAEAMRENKHAEYKQGFRFEVPKADQGDPDCEVFATLTNRSSHAAAR